MAKVKENKMEAVAMTDHGVMYGTTEFWMAAKDNGIKPIIGCEIYLSPASHTIKQKVNGINYYHLVVLAINATGYRNLNKLVSIAQLDGFYYKPRIDKETLAQYSEGLICTSACLAGPLARHISRGEEEKAIEWLKFLKHTFKDRFVIELQRNGFKNTDEYSEGIVTGLTIDDAKLIKKQMKANFRMRELAEEHKIPVVVSADAHYLNKDDRYTQEILFAIKDGKRVDDPTHRLGYLDTYVKTPEEMIAHFQDIPEVIQNTLNIADKVENFDITFKRVEPKYFPEKKDEGKTSQVILHEMSHAGAKVIYPEVTQALTDRINFELDIIHNKGYDDYMLVVADIIKWARSQGIVVGVRGSGAGSVVAYCCEITNVEPIGWELYFERFLNPERPSPPDIDMDFQDDRREEVIQYVETKYGKDNVAAICAIGRMKTKAAIRDVARATGVDLKMADQLSKMVHTLFGKVYPIEKMMTTDAEFATLVNSSDQLKQLRKDVGKLEGIARHVSTHACGILITPEPITNYVSVQRETGGADKIVTQQEGTWLEPLGLMKFDFLGVRNLTIIKNCLELVEKYHGVKIVTRDIPLNDEKTFKLLGRGETVGVFQFESPPMQKYLRELQPRSVEDLCFMVSAYRPGPMKYIPEYIDCHHGRKTASYIIPEMEPILKKTHGFAIYQEQVIKIAVDVAGYSMGAADMLRRAMGKKKLDVMKKEEIIFKKGVNDRGYDDKIATQLWDYLLPFADYGFNKAHGASYALIAYWCAYLKANYPIEFITGLLHSDLTDFERISIDMAESRKMNFTILPPDINKSAVYFTIENSSYIRFGLGAIKNVGVNLVQDLIDDRDANGPYKSLEDFSNRAIKYKITKKAFECLAKIGAFDNFAGRNQVLAIAEDLFSVAQEKQRQHSIGQVDLFGGSFSAAPLTTSTGSNFNTVALPQLDDVPNKQKIDWEKELLGSYITAHPLDEYKLVLINGDIKPISILVTTEGYGAPSFDEKKKYQFLGMIAMSKTVFTKAGNKAMAMVDIEDQNGLVNAVIFPRQYEQLKGKFVSKESYIFIGNVADRDGKKNLIIDEIYPASESHKLNELMIDITRVDDPNELTLIKSTLSSNKGSDIKLRIIYGKASEPKRFETYVTADGSLLKFLEKYRR